MNHDESGPVTALVCLREALDALGDALVVADADGILAVEGRLEAAVSAVPALSSHFTSGASLHGETERLWESLTRCRRLGASLDDIVRATLVAYGHESLYGRLGDRVPVAASTLSARG